MPLIHSLTLPPDRGTARQFRAVFSRIMDSIGIAPDERDHFLLAMSEIVTNLALHPSPLPLAVRVALRRTRASWVLEVADDGPPFDDIEEVTSHGGDMGHTLRESGMGMHLVAERFPDFQYQPKTNSGDSWNTFTLNLLAGATRDYRASIFVVDDDPVFLKVIDGYLRDTFEVTGFTTAAGALSHLKNHAADLIISDIQMPETDGYGFRRHVQKLRHRETIPFIFLTGADTQDNRDDAAELSIDDYLTKPVEKLRLLSTLKRVLRRASDLQSRLGDRLDTEITQALEPGIQKQPKGYEIAVAHEAASAGGGDVLVDRKLADGHLLVLADVMGHGEQAKFFAHALTGYVHGAVRALSRETSPSALLGDISELFLSDRILKQSLATALVIILKDNGDIAVAAAGHQPPFILRANDIVNLSSSGPLLGLMEEPEYSEDHVRIGPGERMILFTDGISEAGRIMIDQPRELFRPLFEDLSEMTDRQIVEEMLSHAQERSDYRLQDDATAVVIRKADA